MNINFRDLLIFAMGAATGSLIAAYFMNRKKQVEYEDYEDYEDYDDTELDTEINDSITESITPTCSEKPNLFEYAKQVGIFGYTTEEGEEEDPDGSEPYVINPGEFGEKDGYRIISLKYFADGVLTDDWDVPFDEDDIPSIVGKDFASHFGEWEDDSVYVRNDMNETDYEILAVEHKFSDILPPPSSDDTE